MESPIYKYTILVAKDDIFQSQRINLILQKNGFEVILTKDGLSAYEYVIQNSLPDIIITDVNMPNMNGYELTTKIKEIYPDVFVLILTASAKRDAIQSAYAAGATDFVRKPVDSLELIARINNLIKLKDAKYELKNALAKLEEKNNILEVLSTTDGLTGLYNRRHFFEELKKYIYNSNRYTHPMTLFMFDIASFKTINDNHGHPVGDKVLCDIAEILQRKIRETDMVGRFGGDEFLIMLCNTNLESAIKTINKLLPLIKDITIGGTNEKVKISGGLYQYQQGLTIDEFVANTDKLLYRAKEAGKNRVEYNI